MKVILLGELPGKGGEGDIIDVADGYANNCLLPKNIAIKATPGNLKQLEQRRNNIAKREAARIEDANKLKEALEGKSVRIIAAVGDEGVLFGSVTATQVAEAIQDQLGQEVDRRRVALGSPIKTVGVHPVSVSLYREIETTINVLVNDEAGFAAGDGDGVGETAEAEAPLAEEATEDSAAE